MGESNSVPNGYRSNGDPVDAKLPARFGNEYVVLRPVKFMNAVRQGLRTQARMRRTELLVAALGIRSTLYVVASATPDALDRATTRLPPWDLAM